MEIETIIYIILGIVFVIISGLAKQKPPQQGQQNPIPQPPSENFEAFEELPENFKKMLLGEVGVDRVPDRLEEAVSYNLDSVEGIESDYLSYLDKIEESVEVESNEEHEKHFDSITKQLQEKRNNNILKWFDLKKAVIYHTILERKYK